MIVVAHAHPSVSPSAARWLAGDQALPATHYEGVWHHSDFPSLVEAVWFAASTWGDALWGEWEIEDRAVSYRTYSGKGVYRFSLEPDGRVTVRFEGFRQSFRDGCPPFAFRLVLMAYDLRDGWDYRLRLDGDVYGHPGKQFIGAATVASFELYDATVHTTEPETVLGLIDTTAPLPEPEGVVIERLLSKGAVVRVERSR